MPGTRIEKYRKYRASIAQSSDNIPVLKTPSNSDKYVAEAGFFQAIVRKKRIENILVFSLIVIIITLLVVFGIILF